MRNEEMADRRRMDTNGWIDIGFKGLLALLLMLAVNKFEALTKKVSDLAETMAALAQRVEYGDRDHARFQKDIDELKAEKRR